MYESAGSRDYAITSDTLAHALHLTAEATAELEVDVNLTQLSVEKGSLPQALLDYWQDQQTSGQLVQWIVSHSLPRQQQQDQGTRQHHPLHLITPTGNSLW